MLTDLERTVLQRLKQATPRGTERAALTVGELADAFAVDRRVLDHALGHLVDAGLIRIRGDVSTSHSHVELTAAAARAPFESDRRSA